MTAPRIVLLLATCAALAMTASAQTYTYKTISFPNTYATYFSGINSGGEIVGWYFTTTDETYGLTYFNGSFTTVQLGPAGGQTYLAGVNDAGEIVGSYIPASLEYVKNYRIEPDGTRKLLFTGSSAAGARIDGLNDVGSAIESSSGLYGENAYLTTGGSTMKLQPGAFAYPAALDNENEVVGYSYSGSSPYTGSDGFLFANNSYTTIDYAGQSVTALDGINDYGVIVGTYTPLDQYPVGFLYDHGTFSPVAVPGADGTNPSAINNNGVIVGYYWGADNSMGAFVAAPTNQ